MSVPESPPGTGPMGGLAPVPVVDGAVARGFAAATAQIDLALREAQPPIEALGGSLEQISGELAALRALAMRSRGQLDPESRRTMEAALAGLGVQLTTAVQSLQFYDRLFQHLSHVHDFLFGAADLLEGAQPAADDQAADPAIRWEQLRERLFRRLLSDSQRELLDAVLPPGHWRGDRVVRTGEARVAAVANSTTDASDVELF